MMPRALVVTGSLDGMSLGEVPAPKNIARIDRRQAWPATLDAAIEHGVAFCIAPDASVSPGVAAYVDAATRMYGDDHRVAFFGLSAWRWRADNRTPFVPIEDGYDALFSRTPPPVNFAVTAAQAHRLLAQGVQTQADVQRRLTVTKGYGLHPRASLVVCGEERLSRQLDPGVREWRLGALDVALAVYGENLEIEASVLRRLNPALTAYAFDVELSGETVVGDAPYLLSSRPCSAPILSFALEMTPWETNVAFNVGGGMFSLAPRDAFGPMTNERRLRLMRHLTRHTYIGGYLKQFVGRG